MTLHLYGMSELVKTDGDIHQDEFPARLRQAIDAFGSVTALAQAIDRSDGAVRKWLRGASEPNVSDLRAICTATGANVEWLVTGKGDSRIVPKGVRQMPPVYRVGPPTEVDNALLESIMDTLDEALLASGVEVARTKRSAMVVTLYGLFRHTNAIDRDAVDRLVKLAA